MKTQVKIRAVIWDLGGVILRTDDPTPRAHLASRCGISRAELEQIALSSESAQRAELGEISGETHWDNVRRLLKIDTEGLDEVQREFWAGERVDSELVTFVRAMHPEFQTVLLSNAWVSLREQLTQKWQIADAFDEIILSAEVGLRKPDQRIFTLAVNKLGLAPEEVVLVDDLEENLSAARDAGISGVPFKSSAQVGTELLEMLQEPVLY